MRTFLAILAISAISAIGTGLALAQNGDVAVVVNEKNSVANLSISDLRKLFAGEKRSWPGGAPVKLFVRASGARERVVLLKLLGMSEMEYKEYWTTQVYRGQALSEPVALFSNAIQREAVLTYPGALVMVTAADVRPGMKVLRVDGHLPGEAGYPLK